MTRVTRSAMRWVAAILVLAASHLEPVAAQQGSVAADTVLIEIREARMIPGEGYARMQSLRDGAPAYVGASPIVSDGDITAAEAWLANGQVMLVLQLTPDGEARLNAFTNTSREVHMAILVRGQLANALPVHGPISYDDRMNIVLELPPAMADDVIATVEARWEPIPRQAPK